MVSGSGRAPGRAEAASGQHGWCCSPGGLCARLPRARADLPDAPQSGRYVAYGAEEVGSVPHEVGEVEVEVTDDTVIVHVTSEEHGEYRVVYTVIGRDHNSMVY